MSEISWTTLFITITTCLIGIIYIYFKYTFQYWKKKAVPYIQPSFPFGNTLDLVFLRKTWGDFFAEHYLKLKGKKFGGIYFVHKPCLVLTDPELIKAFLVKDFDHFHDHGFAFDEKIDPLSGNLFMQTGLKWKDLRTKLSPTFTSGKMKMMFQTLVDCGNELKKHLNIPAEKGELLELKELLAKFSTDVIASCAFGIQCNCIKNPDAEFRQWGRRVFEPTFDTIARNTLYMFMPSLAMRLKVSSTPNDITNFFLTMVNETVSYREKHGVKRNDFLQLLIDLKNGKLEGLNGSKLHNEKQSRMTMNELAAQVFVFFLAGFETSSTTMSFCLYELARNPNIQDKVRHEIDSVLRKHGGNLTYEAIQEMDYLDKVVSETLRKFPPVPILSRECNKEYTIPDTDVTIDKGTQIFIPIQALQYDQKYFPHPERFDPHRFDDEIKNKRHNFVYLPFGEGPRICIGMRFGLMQTKVGLVSLLSDYQFHVCQKTAIPLVMDPKQFTTTPIEGVWLQITKRGKHSA